MTSFLINASSDTVNNGDLRDILG